MRRAYGVGRWVARTRMAGRSERREVIGGAEDVRGLGAFFLQRSARCERGL